MKLLFWLWRKLTDHLVTSWQMGWVMQGYIEGCVNTIKIKKPKRNNSKMTYKIN